MLEEPPFGSGSDQERHSRGGKTPADQASGVTVPALVLAVAERALNG